MKTSAQQAYASVHELRDHYVLSPVLYKKQPYTVTWSKQRLLNGIAQHADTLVEQTQNDLFIVPNGPILFATLSTLYENRAHPNAQQRAIIEKMHCMFHNDFSSPVPFVTSTLTQYRCSYGSDYVKHNAGYTSLEQVLTKVHVRGPEECISEHTKKAHKVLLGTSHVEEIKKVLAWTSGKVPYLLRLNPRKREICVIEGVLAFHQSVSDEFYVNAFYCQKGISRGVCVTPL